MLPESLSPLTHVHPHAHAGHTLSSPTALSLLITSYSPEGPSRPSPLLLSPESAHVSSLGLCWSTPLSRQALGQVPGERMRLHPPGLLRRHRSSYSTSA